MVTVACTVFNHENYLRKCLDGFVIQKTNFAFEVIVHDDASTDGSADIIREYTEKYPNLFYPIYQLENQVSQGVSPFKKFILPHARGKYFAICEGDDYWCDENKLQMQFDIMESHPECHLCVHTVRCVTEKGDITQYTLPSFQMNSGLMNSERFLEIIGRSYSFQSSSYFRRMDDVREFDLNPPLFYKIADVGDIPALLYSALLGDVWFINMELSHYRLQSIGSWSYRQSRNSRLKMQHCERMIRLYEEFNKFTDNKYSKLIEPNIRWNQFNYYSIRAKDDRKCARVLLNKRYKSLFRDSSWKFKIYVVLCAYAPFFTDLYFKIKK